MVMHLLKDLRIHQSKNGLTYFYPRLIKGGYIFIHDYNSKSLRGVIAAVEKYEKENRLMAKMPIPDLCGTLVVTK